MATFFIGDPHFGHKKVSELRGFEDVPQHDATIMRNWREVVSDQDDVFVMGDMAMSNPQHHFGKLEKLPGKKHLIIGNHDYCHPMRSNSHNRIRQYYDVFESVQLQSQIAHMGKRFILHHFPYQGDHALEDRHSEWRPRDMGQPLIHAHTHSDKKYSVSERGTPQICVSLEAWDLYPASFAEIWDVYNQNY